MTQARRQTLSQEVMASCTELLSVFKKPDSGLE